MPDQGEGPKMRKRQVAGAVVAFGLALVAILGVAQNWSFRPWEVAAGAGIVAVFLVGGLMYLSVRAGLVLAFVLALFGAGFAIGVVAWSPGEAGGRTGAAGYARHVNGVLRDLRETVARVGPGPAATEIGAVYEDRAAQLSQAFDAAATAIQYAPVSRADRRPHRRLVDRLRGTADAYEELAVAVADRSGSQGEVDAARRGVRRAGRRLLAAEEALERNGYRLVFPGMESR